MDINSWRDLQEGDKVQYRIPTGNIDTNIYKEITIKYPLNQRYKEIASAHDISFHTWAGIRDGEVSIFYLVATHEFWHKIEPIEIDSRFTRINIDD